MENIHDEHSIHTLEFTGKAEFGPLSLPFFLALKCLLNASFEYSSIRMLKKYTQNTMTGVVIDYEMALPPV